MPPPRLSSGPAADTKSRDPYVIKACEECRRRKIRCNGVKPCRRCDRLSLVCFYRTKRQHNSHPQQGLEIHDVLSELNSLRAEYEALANRSGRGSSASDSPPPQLPPQQQVSEPEIPHQDRISDLDSGPSDPLLEISSKEMHRLLYVYDEHIQFLYPLADMDAAEASAEKLDLHRNQAHPELPLDEADSACLKLVLVNAMGVDDRDHDELSARLFESAQRYVSGLAGAERLDVRAVRAFLLVAQYYAQHDKSIPAWRSIGSAVRAAEELGLNLQQKVEKMFPRYRERKSVQQLYWSIYILDHCWSLHMGFNPAIRDTDATVGIAKPDEYMPFLSAMVDCTQIISKAWKVICPSINQVDSLNLRAAQDRLEDVYRSIREWQSSSAVESYFYKQQHLLNWWQARCLKTFLYLRANELCIFLCRPILLTRNSLAENRATMEFATQLAKDSVSVLIEFHQFCSGMRVLPFVFNQFLSSALATLFLAIVQEPHRYITREGDCRPLILAAKALIEDLEKGDCVQRRFYSTCRESFALLNECRILGRDPEKVYTDDPEPTTEYEFRNALRLLEPLFGRAGHDM